MIRNLWIMLHLLLIDPIQPKNKENKMKKLFLLIVVVLALLLLVGCDSEANVASHNLSVDADMFRINRRIVFYNSITDTYLLSIEGRCSLGNYDVQDEVSITCKVSETEYMKHF